MLAMIFGCHVNKLCHPITNLGGNYHITGKKNLRVYITLNKMWCKNAQSWYLVVNGSKLQWRL